MREKREDEKRVIKRRRFYNASTLSQQLLASMPSKVATKSAMQQVRGHGKALPRAMKNVISIQSHVVYGAAGN